MAENDKPTGIERVQTDDSLRIERSQADRALAERQVVVERDADQVVQRARKHADAVLLEERSRADQRREDSTAHAVEGPVSAAERREKDIAGRTERAARQTIALERGVEDAAVRDERATADENLRREREEMARVLSRLLPLERDKTDRHLLTERVRSDDAVAHRDDFLGMVSHDLRNLLSGIVLSATLLEKGPGDDESRRRLISTNIQRYAARMNRLIGDLVDVASIDAGKLVVTAADLDSAKLIQEAVEMFQAAAVGKGISLTSEVRADAILATFDHDRMLQVMANLITNAIKFTNPGGSILVRCQRQDDHVQISVVDTGCGIPDKMLAPVFERFWKAGKNDGPGGGLGLGLYISRCIVEAHSGTIWAESQVGVGSTVTLTLPAPAA